MDGRTTPLQRFGRASLAVSVFFAGAAVLAKVLVPETGGAVALGLMLCIPIFVGSMAWMQHERNEWR